MVSKLRPSALVLICSPEHQENDARTTNCAAEGGEASVEGHTDKATTAAAIIDPDARSILHRGASPRWYLNYRLVGAARVVTTVQSANEIEASLSLETLESVTRAPNFSHFSTTMTSCCPIGSKLNLTRWPTCRSASVIRSFAVSTTLE